MEEVQLALVPADISLTEALTKFRQGTRALIVRSPVKDPMLVTAGDIMAACNDAVDSDRSPNEISVGTVIPVRAPVAARTAREASIEAPKSGSFAGGGTASAHSPVVESAYRKLFSDNDDRYAIHSLRSDSALIITASKRFAFDLSSAVMICRCEGDPVHTFEPRQLITPGVCNKAHRAQVHCTQLSLP